MDILCDYYSKLNISLCSRDSKSAAVSVNIDVILYIKPLGKHSDSYLKRLTQVYTKTVRIQSNINKDNFGTN